MDRSGIISLGALLVGVSFVGVGLSGTVRYIMYTHMQQISNHLSYVSFSTAL